MGSSKDAAAATTIGFFTTVQSERAGWTGGLLVLNGSGRPLEFQCTLPIRPSRAHEILFGTTLRQHLISEVIGPTLLQKCRTPISLLCCTQAEAISLQEHLPERTDPARGTSDPSTIVAIVQDDDNEAPDRTLRQGLSGHDRITLGNATLWVAAELVEAAECIAAGLTDIVDTWEPFERITEAIREAQSQMARAA
ncbi:hypothetical protein [Allorhodopirellula heiligendammensis]|uniref:Uncharacterized protein n=1 Tax=Allorhodopirellula heiligendammensis TaxID=2714739 RepID=A0A5C6BUI9_9BACT|nr:hypothetical protein [Allorhodopirellula heiligendammensis]TWU15933.1 hypothetical protein Poly21_31370 [Allorhodopirellula heiligendammensis]